MDIGKILRERANFRTYAKEPKKPPKRWGIFPSLKVDQLIFSEEDDFRCSVTLFSYDKDDITQMQADTITRASLGMKNNGWDFWLHAANHGIERVPGRYRSTINFVFKVRFPNTGGG